MAFFSIENIFSHKIIQNIISINYNIIMNNNIKNEKNTQEHLSLKHPRMCQPKIPIKDISSLTRPNLKTNDDIFDIQSAIISILSHTEEIEYNTIHHYYKWDCKNYSEEYGYTHFYIVVSMVDELSYYAIEIQRIAGTKPIIRYIIQELTDKLNII